MSPPVPALETTVPPYDNRMHHAQVGSIGLRRHHRDCGIARASGVIGATWVRASKQLPWLAWDCSACRKQSLLQKIASAVKRGAEWLATMQNADGSLGVCAALPQPGWATPYAILLWSALDTLAPERQRAAAWLLAQKGLRPPVPEIARSPVGHDPTLVGWPWIENTHSWLEPTALAILALSRLSLHDHRSRRRGNAVIIIDRALPHGGWNPGGKAVFGRELRPQPGPTGIAMLALATCATQGAAERSGSGHRLSSSNTSRRHGPDLPGLGRARPPCLGCRAARCPGLVEPVACLGRRASRFGRRARACCFWLAENEPWSSSAPEPRNRSRGPPEGRVRIVRRTDRSMIGCMKWPIGPEITKHETSIIPHRRRRPPSRPGWLSSRLAIMTKRRFGPTCSLPAPGPTPTISSRSSAEV